MCTVLSISVPLNLVFCDHVEISVIGKNFLRVELYGCFA